MENKNLEAKIYIPKKQGGLFYAYIYDKESQEVVHKSYFGINKDPDPSERLAAAQDTQKAYQIKLKSGWIPKTKKSSLPKFTPTEINIILALDEAIVSMYLRLEKKTVQGYSCTVNYIKEVIQELKWDKNYLHEFENIHIEKAMIIIAEKRKWKNNEYNKNITYIKAVFSELVRLKYIKTNPAHGILSRKKERRIGYIRLTDQEQTTVINHFKKINPNFAVWLKTLYHTGMRPDELRNVLCGMIDVENEVFRLTEDITKTDDNRVIPITQDLMSDLLKFNLKNKSWFLFGKSDSFSKALSFLPAKYQIGKNASNNLWREEVIIKLGINKKQYSHKHQKASHTIQDGGSLEAIQRAFGHSNKITTEIYAQILEAIQLQEFKDKARDYK